MDPGFRREYEEGGVAETPPHPARKKARRPGPAPRLCSGRSLLKSLHRSDLPASPSQLTPRGERGKKL